MLANLFQFPKIVNAAKNSNISTMFTECLKIKFKLEENIYWKESLIYFLELLSSFINTGVSAAEYILKGTTIIEKLFINLIFDKKSHGYTITVSVMQEFSKFIKVLSNIEDDWCQDRLIDIDIIKCLLHIMCN